MCVYHKPAKQIHLNHSKVFFYVSLVQTAGVLVAVKLLEAESSNHIFHLKRKKRSLCWRCQRYIKNFLCCAVHAISPMSAHYKDAFYFAFFFFYHSSVQHSTLLVAVALQQQVWNNKPPENLISVSHPMTPIVQPAPCMDCVCTRAACQDSREAQRRTGSGGHLAKHSKRNVGGPVARKQRPYIMPKAICQPECLI